MDGIEDNIAYLKQQVDEAFAKKRRWSGQPVGAAPDQVEHDAVVMSIMLGKLVPSLVEGPPLKMSHIQNIIIHRCMYLEKALGMC